MNYLNQYKSFINSHHLTEGLRMTVGVILPALVFGYINHLDIGIVVSIGALLVSVTDNPGPVHHRRNGMLVCLLFLFIGALITGFVVRIPLLLTIYLVLSCFFFSMITVYGARAAAIGTANMIFIVLTIDPRRALNTPYAVIIYALQVAGGGLWYILYSLMLYNFRPLRLAQQALGDCIEETASYLQLRSRLYNKEEDFESLFKKILQQQAVVQQKQNDLSELLFKTRSIIKDTSVATRSLVLMYLDLTDIFEKIMTSHQRYSILHQYFDETNILTDFGNMANELSHELNLLGIAVKSGKSTPPMTTIYANIDQTQLKLEQLRHDYLKPDNIEGFISLRKILENIQEIADRIKILQQYSTYDIKLIPKQPDINVIGFIPSQDYSIQLLLSNLTIKADSFRHAIRVCVAVVVGFLFAQIFNIGHSYWVLLTIIVILKPAYSLTKKRNIQRLTGTISGVLIGVAILYLTKNPTILLPILILLMLGSYSTMRRNYFISVLFMTPYLVLFYHFLSPTEFYPLLKDRIVDTTIGSVIAFLASYLLFPSWEKDKVKQTMITMLMEVRNYFSIMTDEIKGVTIENTVRQLSRRKALVALANLSDSFTRMSNEPESRQKGVAKLHKFVVLNQTLTSYVAGFSKYAKLQHEFPNEYLVNATHEILSNIDLAIATLKGEVKEFEKNPNKKPLQSLNEVSNKLMEKRTLELKDGFVDSETRKQLIKVKSVTDQLNLLYNVVVDIEKVSKAYIHL